MALHFPDGTHTSRQPYYIYLGDNHVVEVKRGGLQIGIYVITTSLRRRGVVLPTKVWRDLTECIDIINLAIDLATGSVAIDRYVSDEQQGGQNDEQSTHIGVEGWCDDETNGRLG